MTGVWVGYEKDKSLDVGETGGRAAAPIWADYMTQVVRSYPHTEFPVPDDIVFAYVDRETGKLASPQTVKRVRVAFKVGTVPNSSGDNLPRIGEPGSTRNAATSAGQAQTRPVEAGSKPDDVSDFQRQDYQN